MMPSGFQDPVISGLLDPTSKKKTELFGLVDVRVRSGRHYVFINTCIYMETSYQLLVLLLLLLREVFGLVGVQGYGESNSILDLTSRGRKAFLGARGETAVVSYMYAYVHVHTHCIDDLSLRVQSTHLHIYIYMYVCIYI